MSTLYVDNLEPNLGNAVHAAGHCVQSKHYEIGGSAVNVATATWTEFASVTFTPKYANSHIHIDFVYHVYVESLASNTWRGANVRLLRNGVGLAGDESSHYGHAYHRTNDTDRSMTYQARMFVDTSHDTTSAITYSVQGLSRNSEATMRFNDPDYGDQCRIRIMEIAQ